MDIKAEMMKKAEAAREASRKLGVLSTGVKNEALMAMADALEKRGIGADLRIVPRHFWRDVAFQRLDRVVGVGAGAAPEE